MQRLALLGRSVCTFRTVSTAAPKTAVNQRVFIAPPGRLIGPTRIIRSLRDKTDTQTWDLVDVIHSRNRVALHQALRTNWIKWTTFTGWEGVVHARDIGRCIARFRKTRSAIPPWVLLFVTAFKVRTPEDAAGPLVEINDKYLRELPHRFQAGLLILSAFHLSRFSLTSPLRTVIDNFLEIVGTYTPEDQITYYNLFLKSLAAYRLHWGNNVKLVVSVLNSMETHGSRLWSSTYKQLLNDRHVTQDLAIYLRDRMMREGFVPSVAHLEDYLRLFAQGGAIENPTRYKAEVAKFSDANPLDTPYFPSNDQDPASAFHFLHRLTFNPIPPSNVPNHHSLGFKRSMTDREWTAAFATFTRSSRAHIPTNAVISHYEKSKQRQVYSSLYTYRTLIRALTLRKNYKRAKYYWDLAIRAGYSLDTQTITAGLQLFTESGQPHKAFMILEKHCARIDVPLRADYGFRKPVPLSTIPLNEFMKALRHAGRPDAVFLLWDYMFPLYGIYPNEVTFDVLVQSVRVALRLNRTTTGLLSELLSLSAFYTKPTQPKCRQDALNNIVAIIGQRRFTEPHAYRPYSVWRSPVDRVSQLFWQVMRSSDEKDMTLTNVIPSAQTCFEYAILAGVSGRTEELPEILKAMNKLELEPVDGMLPLVLSFWHDHCAVRAGSNERRKETGSLWKGLIDWISEWRGDDALPSVHDMQHWKMRVLDMKK